MLQSDRHRTVSVQTEADSEPDQDDKYAKRTGSVKRSLQRVLPSIFQPTLPVTTRYLDLVTHLQSTLSTSMSDNVGLALRSLPAHCHYKLLALYTV